MKTPPQAQNRFLKRTSQRSTLNLSSKCILFAQPSSTARCLFVVEGQKAAQWVATAKVTRTRPSKSPYSETTLPACSTSSTHNKPPPIMSIELLPHVARFCEDLKVEKPKFTTQMGTGKIGLKHFLHSRKFPVLKVVSASIGGTYRRLDTCYRNADCILD